MKTLLLVASLLTIGCGSHASDATKAKSTNAATADAETMKRRQEISDLYERWKKAGEKAEYWSKRFEPFGNKDTNSGTWEAREEQQKIDEEAKEKFGVKAELLPQLLK